MRARTRYDDVEATDGQGGPHPLAGVPEEALKAARAALLAATEQYELMDGDVLILEASPHDKESIQAISDAILAAALKATKALTGENPYQRTRTVQPH